MTANITGPSTVTGVPIPGCPVGSAIRRDGFTAHALQGGQVVSSQDGMDAVDMLVALGGPAPFWFDVLASVRAFLADVAEHAPAVDPADLDAGVRALTGSARERRQQAEHAAPTQVTTDWRAIALSHDPDARIRMVIADRLTLHTDHGLRTLVRLASDVEPLIADSVADRDDTLDRDEIALVLARYPNEFVRRKVARKVDLRSPAVRVLSVDPDPGVRQRIDERLHDPNDPDFDDFEGRVVRS